MFRSTRSSEENVALLAKSPSQRIDESDVLGPQLSDAMFEEISTLVKSICGINLHEGKKQLVKARLNKRLRATNLPTYEAYLDHVRSDVNGDELTVMLDSLSTNLTQFFREPKHFEHLRGTVLPEVVRRRSQERQIRIWSAGCSSGEEPYSIAIVLREHLGKSDWNAAVLATDLSTRMLHRAKQGVYESMRLRDVPAGLLSKHFQLIEARPARRYQVAPEVRQMVHFARLNLMERWPMHGPFDAIFCRNVMIYFDKPTQERLVQRFWEILAPGGTLFLGHSESLAGVKHRFHYIQPTVYNK